MTWTELIAHPFWWLTRWFYGRALRVAWTEASAADARFEVAKAELRWREQLVREQSALEKWGRRKARSPWARDQDYYYNEQTGELCAIKEREKLGAVKDWYMGRW